MNKVLVFLLAAVVLGGTGWLWQDYSRRVDNGTSRAVSSPLATEKREEPPVVLVIGDSYVGGSAMNSGPTWPTRMGSMQGWVVIRDGVGGTGYINGEADERAFLDRVQADCERYVPDLVVVAGGINDAGKYPTEQIADVADETITRLRECEPRADIVMLSPFAPASVTPPIAELVPALGAVADAKGVRYVEVTDLLTGQEDLVGSDAVHPNDDGHAYLATKIGAELAPLVDAAVRG